MTTITESRWVEYYGFQRFPFDRPEAGNEEFARPDFLASCFVEPESFERVFGQADGPVTSLLFAARGTGKTACRVMMDYYCQNGLARLRSSKSSEPSYVLGIPHIQLENVHEIARQAQSQTISIEHHVIEIMRQAMPVFVDIIARNQSFVDRIRELPRDDFDDLSLFIIYYSSYLSSSQKTFLRDLGVEMPPAGQPMMGLIGQRAAHTRRPSWENFLFQQRVQTSPLQHLEQWAMLMPKFGISATYVLVDGVDEIMESAGDPNYAHSLIRPLLTHLRLMDPTYPFALKFFLPSEVQPLILSDPAFRKDRGFIIKTIEWSNDDLIKILRERLNALRQRDYEIRDRTAVGFDALCTPDLRGQIEQNIVEIVKGNPRQLMNFCSLMVTSHCSRDIQDQSDPYQLSRQDFEQAKQMFDIETDYQPQSLVGQKPDIPKLIAMGESEELEFKSSMRYDYKLQAVNKDDLGLAIVKTLAGFMNRAGGVLLIGVSDEGEILGIEKDIETLPKKNVDGFQLAFKDLVKSRLGMGCLVYLKLVLEDLDGHTVCMVKIEKSGGPVYVKNGNDNEFYVRVLNSTMKLSLPETVSYIRSLWG